MKEILNLQIKCKIIQRNTDKTISDYNHHCTIYFHDKWKFTNLQIKGKISIIY